MELKQFMTSLNGNEPPESLPMELKALWFDGKGDWASAHEMASDIHTEEGSWIHAYLHRKEGDMWNADYWYRRANKKKPDISLTQEWEEIARDLLKRKNP